MKITWGRTFDNAKIEYYDGKFYLIANNGMFDIEREVLPVAEKAINSMSPGDGVNTVCENKFFAVHAVAEIARHGDCFTHGDKEIETALLAFLTLVDLSKGHEALSRICTNSSSCAKRLAGY